MKPKQLNKKLTLNKETIAHLGDNAMEKARAGEGFANVRASTKTRETCDPIMCDSVYFTVCDPCSEADTNCCCAMEL